MTPLRVIFLGSDAIALPLLQWLAGEGRGIAEVVGVFTQPDRPTGRGQQVAANEIKRWAESRALPVLQPEKITDETRAQLDAMKGDVALVMAYGHILRDEFIQTPRLGTLNLHTSLLPKYRGASPIQSAIAAGEKETGVTLMRIIRQLDAGPIADAERVSIGALDTALDIEGKLSAACLVLLARTLPKLRDETLVFTPQDETAATFCRRLQKTDGALDFSQPSAKLAARINGLFPWPTCVVEISGQGIKVGQADVVEGEGDAGVVQGADAHGVLIGSGEGLLRARKLQRPGGRMLGAAEFLRGFPIPIGTCLPSLPMAELVSAKPFPYKR